jgi:DNA segregation ATPase FtsK/SpoIIIE-like protein
MKGNDIMKINKYKRKLRKYYAAVNIPIIISFFCGMGDVLVYKIDFLAGASEKRLMESLKAAQQTLKLPLFQLHREAMELFFVVSENNNFDNRLLGIITSPVYNDTTKDMEVPFPIGFNAMRRPVLVDLVKYYNWLLGGSGGSGKTTSLQGMIASIAWACSPEKVNLVIFDGAGNLTHFDGLPHLSCTVIQDIEAGQNSILAVFNQFKWRLSIKDTEEFYSLPILVCIYDEFLALVAGISEGIRSALSMLLRRGRHARIYFILAAQDPIVKDIKCDISVITARLAFTCAKPQYSVNILGRGGAEDLFGEGEAYFKSPKHPGLQFIKGAYISPEEIEQVCEHIRSVHNSRQWDNSRMFRINYDDLLLSIVNEDGDSFNFSAEVKQQIDKKTLADVIMWVLKHSEVSCNMIQKRFSIGYTRASEYIAAMYAFGVVDDLYGKLPRKVLPESIEDLSPDVMTLLGCFGYTDDNIIKVIGGDTKDFHTPDDDNEADGNTCDSADLHTVSSEELRS